MIKGFKFGDITDPSNRRHIIIGMNTTLKDVTGIGLPYVAKLKTVLEHPLELGSVLSFHFDYGRDLHMIFCHNIGIGGWEKADQYVRFGLDYLHHTDGDKGEFSIVQIGAGDVGVRDGADPVAIHTAMANSFLPVTLFLKDPRVKTGVVGETPKEMVAYATWHPHYGEQHLSVQ